jgi:hypothetical protein
MRRLITLLPLVALAGCATGGADGPVLPLGRLEQAAVPGQAGKAQVQAALGEPARVVFEDGKEVWTYRYTEASAGAGEYVLLFGADGALLKTRHGPVWTSEKQ